ncbi:MAG TPA: TetR/AcrR family transcriptional regulator [Candidatus Dormibacteraeota bacterium]|nr:TetR/AcrR family transcriptional regulator [Candidatus Dormibacteraeota bacterium]
MSVSFRRSVSRTVASDPVKLNPGRDEPGSGLADAGLPVPAAPPRGSRERILDAAERILSQPGGGEASIDAIAAEAGATKGAVYHHFADRATLLRTVARRVSWADEVRRVLDATAGRPDREQLSALTRAFADFMVIRADLIGSLAANASRDPELATIVPDEILSRGAPLLFGWFQQRMDAGLLRPVDPSLLVQAMFGAVGMPVLMGPVLFRVLEQRGVRWAGENVDEYIDLLIHGLATERWPSPPPR